MKPVSFYIRSIQTFAFLALCVFGVQVYGQTLPVYESFSYATGNLSGKGSPAWATTATGIQVSSGSLDGSGVNLLASIGNKVNIIANGTGVGFNNGTKVDFVAAGVTSGSLYFSFLLKLTDMTGIDTTGVGTPILHLNQRGSGTKVVLSILLYNNAGHVEIGVGKHAAATTILASGFAATGSGSAIEDGAVYLVVAKYQFNASTLNDTVSLWVNPASLGTSSEDASPKVSAIGAGTADTTGDIGRVYVAGGYNAAVDEFRFSSTWADVTPTTVCTTAGITTPPASQTNLVGSAATFSFAATGSALTNQWQANAGSGFTNIPGATGSSYTTAALTATDNGAQFRVIAGALCDGLTVTSTAATLTVADPSGKWFRSATSGSWNVPGTWEQSNDGNSWSPAGVYPNNTSSNITVQAGHTVTVTANISADDLTVQSGGVVDVSNAVFTINDGGPAVDCHVSGALNLLDAAGSAIVAGSAVGAGALQFGSGAAFTNFMHTATTIPAATWDAASSCVVAPAAAEAAFILPGGLGQTFGNFIWDSSTQTQSAILANNLTNVVGDFEFKSGASAASGLCFGSKTSLASDTVTLTVGGAIKVHAGSGNFLLSSGGTAAGTYLVKVGKGIIADAGSKIDCGNAGATSGALTLEFSGNSQFTLGVALSNPKTASYLVDNGATLTLNTPVALNTGRTFTVSPTGTLIGSGTTQLVSGTGSVTYGGTLNITNNLPAFVGGETFVLFGASAYSGSFTSIVPTPPGVGLSWDTSQLAVSGTLIVSAGSGGSGVRINSSSYDGVNFNLSGSAGVANAGLTFSVRTNANFAIPHTSWSVQGGGTCDGSGNFIYSAPISGAGLFYDISIP